MCTAVYPMSVLTSFQTSSNISRRGYIHPDKSAAERNIEEGQPKFVIYRPTKALATILTVTALTVSVPIHRVKRSTHLKR